MAAKGENKDEILEAQKHKNKTDVKFPTKEDKEENTEIQTLLSNIEETQVIQDEEEDHSPALIFDNIQSGMHPEMDSSSENDKNKVAEDTSVKDKLDEKTESKQKGIETGEFSTASIIHSSSESDNETEQYTLTLRSKPLADIKDRLDKNNNTESRPKGIEPSAFTTASIMHSSSESDTDTEEYTVPLQRKHLAEFEDERNTRDVADKETFKNLGKVPDSTNLQHTTALEGRVKNHTIVNNTRENPVEASLDNIHLIDITKSNAVSKDKCASQKSIKIEYNAFSDSEDDTKKRLNNKPNKTKGTSLSANNARAPTKIRSDQNSEGKSGNVNEKSTVLERREKQQENIQLQFATQAQEGNKLSSTTVENTLGMPVPEEFFETEVATTYSYVIGDRTWNNMCKEQKKRCFKSGTWEHVVSNGIRNINGIKYQ